jgi:hypothetical protein
LDPSVKGPLELARIAPAPILTAIPYIETEQDRVAMRRRRLTTFGAYTCLTLMLLLAVHFFAKPLPALISSLTRRIATW